MTVGNCENRYLSGELVPVDLQEAQGRGCFNIAHCLLPQGQAVCGIMLAAAEPDPSCLSWLQPHETCPIVFIAQGLMSFEEAQPKIQAILARKEQKLGTI